MVTITAVISLVNLDILGQPKGTGKSNTLRHLGKLSG